MKAQLILVSILVSCLLSFQALGLTPPVRKLTVQKLERADRPPLTAKAKVLYPFTFLSDSGGRYTFYEPAHKLTLFEDGSVFYIQLDELGDVSRTGTMAAEDLLLQLTIKFSDGFRKGQRVCLNQDTVYLRAGTSMKIKDFYENHYVTLYSPGLFRALDSRSYAVRTSEIENCR